MSGQIEQRSVDRATALEPHRSEAAAWLADYLAHEMRNRLGAVESATRLLLEQDDTPADRRRRLLELILRSVEHARSLEPHVRGLASRGTGRGRASVRMPVDLLVREVVRERHEAAAAGNIELKVGVSCDASVDALDCYALVAALLDHAIERHGRGDVEAGQRWVRLSVRPIGPDDSLRIEVSTNGPAFLEDGDDRGGAGAATVTSVRSGALEAVRAEARRSGGDACWDAETPDGSRATLTLRVAGNPEEKE